MSAVLGSYGHEMDASYAADFSRDREPMKKRSRHPEYRRKGSAPTRVNGMHCRRNKRWSWGSGRGARMANLRAFAGCLAVGLVALLSGRASATPQVFLPVGNPGNVAKTGSNAGIGSVPYAFSMRSTETTVKEYTDFLNAAAKADPNSLYNTNMTGIGITRTGVSGSFVYSASPSFQNRPVTFVSWNSAARYVNWLTTGTAGSNTETGSYNMAAAGSGITTRLPTARYVLPSRDEWFKAAFFSPSAPTGTNGTWTTWAATAGSGTTTPAASAPVGVAPAANRNLSASGTTSNVGAYTTTRSAYGMYDMLGNVTEWSDTPVAGTSANVFSGAYTINDPNVWNSNAALQSRTFSTFNANVGFRVAEIAPVPEPETITLAAFGIVGLCGANWMRRRRKPAAAGDPALAT